MATTRITAGQWRGRVIPTPSGGPMRPTRAMVRQALFNILGDRTRGARLLDLYAGAGSIGFEALSRGAASVTFVDRDRRAGALISSTARRLDCAGRVRVIQADAVRWLRASEHELAATDICFLDAPYRDDSAEEALILLGTHPPPLVVFEHHRERILPATMGGLERVREARYGLTGLTIYARRGDPGG